MNSYELKGDLSIISKIGYINYVLEGFVLDNKLFYRTLGLKDICGLELEFNLSLEMTEAKRILDSILISINKGIQLKDDLITSDLTNAPVLIKQIEPKYKYSDYEKVYRVIFSDEHYLLPLDKNCDKTYKNQLD